MNRVQSVMELPILPTDFNALSQLGMSLDFRPALFEFFQMCKVLYREAIVELLASTELLLLLQGRRV